MSEGIVKRMVSDKTALGEFSKHDICDSIGVPQRKQSDAGTLPRSLV